MSEDYYDILGINKDADPDSIRRAYRKEAKKSHPDSSGSTNSSERFRQIEEAYETLGDSRKREAYDEGRRERRSSSVPADSRPRSGRHPVWERPPFSPAAGPAGPASFFPFTYTTAAEPLLEILLSTEEAMGGLQVPVDVPASLPCPECSGGGFWQRMFCFTCGGAGSIRIRQQLVLQIPPGIQNGREFRISTGDLSIGSIRVRVLVT
jgi:molecular chaperone DnaJ